MTNAKKLAITAGTSFLSLDLLANGNPTPDILIGSPDDLKKFAIASITSLITQVVLKLIENAKEKRTTRRFNKRITDTNPEHYLPEPQRTNPAPKQPIEQ